MSSIDQHEVCLAAEGPDDAALRDAADRLPALVYMTDSRLSPVFFNRAWREFAGISADAGPEEGFARVHPEDAQAVARWRAAGASGPLQYRLRRADGVYRWVDDRVAPLRGPDGAAAGWMGSCTDVSHLRQADETYALLVTNLSEVVFQTDPTGRWTFLNGAWAEITGWSVEETLGRHFLDWVDPPLREGCARSFQETLAGGAGHVRHESRFLTRRGPARWVQVLACVRRGADGAVLGTFGTIIDVHEQRVAEEAVRHSERLLRHLTAAVPGAVYELEISPDGAERYGFMGEGLRELAGLDPAAVVRDRSLLLERIPPEHREAIRAAAGAAEQGNGQVMCDIQMRHSGGAMKDVRVHASLSRRADGARVWTGVLTDISEAKRAERSLSDRERMLREITAAVPGVVYELRVGPDGTRRFCFVSEGVRALLGIEPEELEANDALLLERVAPEHRERVLETRTRAIQRMEPWLEEFMMVLPDGGRRFIRAHVMPRRLADGSVAWSGVLTDISEAKRTEEALRRSEERAQLALQTTADGLWDWNLKTGDLYLTPRGLHMLGLEEPDAITRIEQWRELYHPDDWAESQRLMADHFAGRTAVYEYVRRLRHRDGRYLWVLCRGSVVSRGPGGEPLRMVGTNVDITGRKEAEEALSKSVQRFQALAALAPAGIFQCDASGRLTYVNDAVCAMMSIDRERMLGAGWAGALHPEDRDGVVGAWRGVVREPREYSSEHRLLVDGQVRWVVERATVVRDGGGRVESFLGTVVDITAIKEAEQQLRESLAQQREMLRRETSLRRELDHRVRNNLASLLGLIAVYERSGRDPREIADAMRGKVLAMKSLHEIIASSPGSPVALAGLVEQIAAQLLTPDEIHRVELEGGAVRIPARQAGAVAIILQELFTNARKHGALSALGGCVRVRWSTEEQTGGGTLLSVAWSERDGPAVARPDRSGVGLRLVEGFAASDLRGGCDFSFDGDGFGCILRARFEAGVSTAANSQGSGVS